MSGTYTTGTYPPLGGGGGGNISAIDLPLQLIAGTLSIQLANTSTNGYLSAFDWNRFNTAAGGGVTAVGTIDSQTPSANALTIIGGDIYAQSASGTAPGMVNLATQTFAGDKNFTGQVTTTQRLGVGTNTPNANAKVDVASAYAWDMLFEGTKTAQESVTHSQVGLYMTQTYASTTGSVKAAGVWFEGNFAPPAAQTITTAAAYWASLYTTGSAGTINSLIGFYYDGNNAIAGTVTSMYGAYLTTPPTGTVSGNMALYVDNMSVGYNNVSLFGTHNALFEGQVAIGTSVVSAGQLTVSTVLDKMVGLQGTQTQISATPSQSTIAMGVTYAPTGNVTYAVGYRNNPEYAPGLGITITNAIACHLLEGIGSGSAGTVTNAYTLYVAAPLYGSTVQQAAYMDNLSVGYPLQTLNGTNNALFSGKVSIGTATVNAHAGLTIEASLGYGLSVQGTQTATDGFFSVGAFLQQIIAPTTGADAAVGFWANNSIIANSAQTIDYAVGIYSSPTFNSNVGTVSAAFGFYYDGSGAIAGTVTNIYGGYFTTPPSGAVTANLALYADNLSVGYNMVSLHGTNNSIFNGQMAIGTSTIDSNAQLVINSADSYCLATTGTLIASDTNLQAALALYNTFSPITTGISSGIQAELTFASASGIGMDVASGLLIECITTGNLGTIDIITGVSVVGISIVGVVNNAYSGYFLSPLSGTVTANQALYADNMSIGDSTLNLNGTNDLHVAGKTVTSTFKMTTGATNTYVMTSDASGNGTWQANGGGGGVTTIGAFDGGTANANALWISGVDLYAQSASITYPGMVNITTQSFAGNKTFTGSVIVEGQAALYNSAVDANSAVVIGGFYPQGLYLNGISATVNSGNQAGILMGYEFNPTSGSTNSYGIWSNPTFIIPTGQTTTVAASIVASINTTSNVGTIGTVYGVYYDGSGTYGGTIDNVFGGYFKSPPAGIGGFGHGNIALYADNLAIGYNNVPLNAHNWAIFADKMALGISTPDPNSSFVIELNNPNSLYLNVLHTTHTTATNSQVGILIKDAFLPVTSISLAYGVWSNPQMTQDNLTTITTAACFTATMGFSTLNAGVTTTYMGFYADAGSTVYGGTLVNQYSAYFTAPGSNVATTANQALYTDNLSVGYPALSLYGTNNAFFAGDVAIGTTSLSAQFTVSTIQAINMFLGGNMVSLSGGNQIGIYCQPNFVPTAAATGAIGILVTPEMAPSGSGSITTGFGILIQAGTLGGNNNVTTGYGLYATTPAYGSSVKQAIYTDNLSVGYPSQTLGSSHNVLIAGSVAIGTSTVHANTSVTLNTTTDYGLFIEGNSATTSLGSQYSILVDTTMIPTSGSNESSGITCDVSYIAPSGQTISNAANFIAGMTTTGNVGTINDVFGFYFNGGGPMGGTVNNAYGGYFVEPDMGTVTGNIALYADNISIGDNTKNLNGTSNLFVAGKAILTTFQLTTSPTNGYYLICDSAGNGTWQAGTGGSGVTTIGAFDGGTANANGLYISGVDLYAQSASVTYPGMVNITTQSFAGNKSFTGTLNIGTSTSVGFTQLTLNTTTANGMVLQGTQTNVVSNNQASIQATSVFAPSVTNPYSSGIWSDCTWAIPSTQTTSWCSAFRSSLAATGNVGAITNLVGFYYDGTTNFAGTVTSCYGAFLTSPNTATGSALGNMALYADNMSIGYPLANLFGTNEVIISGKVSIGTSTSGSSRLLVNCSGADIFGVAVSGTQTTVSGASMASFQAGSVFAPVSGANFATGFFSACLASTPNLQTIQWATGFQASLYATNNLGTITNLCGFYYDGSTNIGGVVTNCYGGYFTQPAGGPVAGNVALYADNISVGFPAISLSGSNNLAVAGQTQTATFKLTTSPGAGYLLSSDSSGNGTWQNIGQQIIASAVGTVITATATTISSISITTPGTWVISGQCSAAIVAGGNLYLGVSTTNNAFSGTDGVQMFYGAIPAVIAGSTSVMGTSYVVGTTTTFYLVASPSAATTYYACSIRAERIQ
jgi:hypothetical protein